MARKILLADDSVTAQNMGRKILADAGYEVITVNNGSAALKRISEQKPDVIVLDVYMPGYSGLEVCQRLKEVGETARIPILLTVGKLEPFKPEEVKRVRADGYIVKPFEASELLSALSKLEDRIVPRAEASKPGRFSRAIAMDQPAYDKTVAIEEDTSWKNRIAFPSKKKKEAQPEPDDPAAYNPVNKDLQTVIEHKIAETPSNGKADEKLDLGALAPAGLPKDVTPEEIAALAAAAAQIQGKVAESKIEEAADVPPATQKEAEVQKPESKEQAPVVAQAKFEVIGAQSAEVSVEKSQEQVESKDVAAASEASKEEAVSAESGSWSQDSADEPVTMAVSARAESEPSSTRWTALPVALAPEDAAISLEQEMQKAYAAFAAAESGHGASISTAPSTDSPVAAASSSPVETPAPESVLPVPATIAPEAAQSLAAIATAATDAVTAAAEQLEAVAASVVSQNEALPGDSTASPAAAITMPVQEQSSQKSEIAESAIEVPAIEKAERDASPEATKELRAEESKETAPVADIPSTEVHEVPAEVSASPDVPAASE